MAERLGISLITIFPELFQNFLDTSLVGKARSDSRFDCSVVNLRDYAEAPHYKVDDEPYGGGAGMVLKPEPLTAAVTAEKKKYSSPTVILMSPSGERFTQSKALDFAKRGELILICGRYEGVDERFIQKYVDEVYSIGDYVLMGGEIPAMAVIEATLRLMPGVLGNEDSIKQESFSDPHTLEGPQYTRPAIFEGEEVPAVLTSGNHKAIDEWRHEQAKKTTEKRRPDLFKED